MPQAEKDPGSGATGVKLADYGYVLSRPLSLGHSGSRANAGGRSD
jgi:hypothetical protein